MQFDTPLYAYLLGWINSDWSMDAGKQLGTMLFQYVALTRLLVSTSSPTSNQPL